MGSQRDIQFDDQAAELALDRALARLSSVDHEPLAARAQLVAAQRRLGRRAAVVSRLERSEPALLWAFAAAHLAWTIVHVLSAAGG
jgi:hypothetical protein